MARSSCPLCGVGRTPADSRGPAWSSEHTADGVRWICGGCTRAHLAEIECGLPPGTDAGSAFAAPGPVDLPATA